MKKISFAVVILVLFNSAFAADWELYFTNDHMVKLYTDKASIFKLKNGNLQLWEKEVYPEISNSLGSGFLYLWEIDCADRKFKIKEIQTLDNSFENIKAAAALNEVQNKDWLNFQPIDEDTRRLKTWCGIGS